jgi:hypothetical protein
MLSLLGLEATARAYFALPMLLMALKLASPFPLAKDTENVLFRVEIPQVVCFDDYLLILVVCQST